MEEKLFGPTVIDATDAVAGRLASRVAKRLLMGEKIIIINAEKAIIAGRPKQIEEKFLARRQRGSRKKGPFYPKYPDAILRRAIRGMLPRRKVKGMEAMKRLKVFMGQPEEYKEAKKVSKQAKDLSCRYITLKQVSKSLGAKRL